MDRKSIAIIAGCVVMLVVWQFVIVPKYWPYKPPQPSAHTVTNGVVQGTLTNGSNVHQQLEQAPQTAASMTHPGSQLEITAETPEQLLVVSNENARYTFTSYGGGLKLVELLAYPETIPSWRNKKAQAGGLASLNTYTPSPTLAVLDGSAVQGDGVFTLMRTATGIRAEKTLTNGLTIVKDFSPTTNFLVNASVWLENHSTQSLSLPEQEWTVGTATPMNPDDRGTPYIGMMWSDGDKMSDTAGATYFSSRGIACMPRTPPAEYRLSQTNIAWAAVHNQYFALAVVPHDSPTGVVMRKVDLPRPVGEEFPMYSSNGYTAALVYPAITLSTNQIVQRQFALYIGPKEYKTLARVATELNNNLDAIMNFGRILGFFSKALLLTMNFLHAAISVPYGWVIVLITVLLRAVFWPLTAAGTRSMKRMQALQPQVKAIQEKYKDDPVKAQKKQMELWKENKVNPMGGCLPALIQMPVFIGFYTMIRTAIELRGAHFLWVTDLSKPDTLFLVPGINFPFNLLPLLMVGVMVWQAHLTPPSPGMDPGQQKMMRYMPALFLVFLYNYSSGMALYMFVSTLLGIIQTKLTKTQPAPAATPALTSPPKKKK
ncbi:MAG TPA: membrane protein insertase YidC [Verrucomicrobiae bacterium]|jgi:YidC/Oxa1 family membrane protein insertase|nr:membrane protein insertase YidC [Verrucomicrobiae bacterium]